LLNLHKKIGKIINSTLISVLFQQKIFVSFRNRWWRKYDGKCVLVQKINIAESFHFVPKSTQLFMNFRVASWNSLYSSYSNNFNDMNGEFSVAASW